jgi:DNA-nicking Smr family endonuclease
MIEDEYDDEPVEVPITGELDLHTFRPNEIGSLLPEYFRECRIKGLLSVRVIHGKGSGTLREGVHRLLERLPEVESFRLGDQTSGSWGATLVRLREWPVDGVEAEGS